jgi:hypothetical protein
MNGAELLADLDQALAAFQRAAAGWLGRAV